MQAGKRRVADRQTCCDTSRAQAHERTKCGAPKPAFTGKGRLRDRACGTVKRDAAECLADTRRHGKQTTATQMQGPHPDGSPRHHAGDLLRVASKNRARRHECSMHHASSSMRAATRHAIMVAQPPYNQTCSNKRGPPKSIAACARPGPQARRPAPAPRATAGSTGTARPGSPARRGRAAPCRPRPQSAAPARPCLWCTLDCHAGQEDAPL